MSGIPENNEAPDALDAPEASDALLDTTRKGEVNVPQAGGNDNSWTILSFLRAYYEDRPFVLHRKNPDTGRWTACGYDDAARAAEQFAKFDGVENAYFQVNETPPGFARKPREEDIVAARWLQVDIDARACEPLADELQRIGAMLKPDALAAKGIPQATLVIFSGGGYQAFWKLDAAIEPARFDQVRALNQTLTNLLGGDHTFDISRVMRLPNTTNLPDAKKLAKGRVQTMARVEFFDPSLRYAPEDFPTPPDRSPPPAKSARRASARSDVPRVDDLDALNLPDRLKVIAIHGLHPEEPKAGDNSRSAWVFDFCCNARRCGVAEEVVLSVLLDARFRISESILEKGSAARRTAERQIAKAREFASDFETDQSGKVLPSQTNIARALRQLGANLSHDQFADRLLIDGRPMADSDVARLYLEIEQRFRFRAPKDYFWMVAEDIARKNGFHPVRDYLDALVWDGVPRLDAWLVTYGGAKDTDYTRAIGAITLIASVRRIRQPGCKFDEMLVLESDQGKLKSTALKILAVREEWFTDDLPLGVESKIVIELTQGRWIVEAAELSGMRKSKVEALKAFLSRQRESARMAYGRIPVESPRSFVIVGTTNSEKYLGDITGNRRFWPIKTGAFDIAALVRDRDQLWAEAAHREAVGESIRLDPSLYDAAAAQQKARQIEEPWVEVLREKLGGGEGRVMAREAWLIVGVEPSRREQEHCVRLGAAMQELGFVRKNMRDVHGKVGKGYQRGDSDEWLVSSPPL